MKATAKILALSLITLLVSCEKPEVDDGRPRIKAISIAGIPQKDIEFIPERYVINVQLPAVAPEGGFKLTFKLTENTEFLEGVPPDGKFSRACGSYILKVVNDKKTAIYRNITSYQINFKPAPGCPEPIGDQPIGYLRDSVTAQFKYITLPFKNANSRFSISTVTLKDLVTGQHHSFGPFPWAPSLNGTCGSADNRVLVYYSPYYSNPKLIPASGSFQVSVSIGCGEDYKTVTFPQPLEVKE